MQLPQQTSFTATSKEHQLLLSMIGDWCGNSSTGVLHGWCFKNLRVQEIYILIRVLHKMEFQIHYDQTKAISC